MSESKSNGIEGPVKRDGFLFFSPLDLARYELAQLKAANALQAVRLREKEISEYQRRANDELRAMQCQLEQEKAQARRIAKDLEALQTALMTRYDIDLRCVTYDDETGRIILPDTVPIEEVDHG